LFDGKIIKTIGNLPLYPVKVEEGPNNTIAVLCSVDGVKGEVVFLENGTFKIKMTIVLDGNLTDIKFDGENAYVTSNDLINDKESFLHRVNLKSYEVKTIRLKGKYTYALDENNKYVFIGISVPNNIKDKSLLSVYDKNTLKEVKNGPINPAPHVLKMDKNMLYILHFNITTSFGGLLSIYNIETGQIKTVKFPLFTDSMLLQKDTILLSSMISQTVGTYNLSTKEYDQIREMKGVLSNITGEPSNMYSTP
jgi:hypothetical protein